MATFESIKVAVISAAAAALPDVIERIVPGGLPGLLDQLQRSGFGKQVGSWLGRGENNPITTQDLRKVISDDQIRQISEKLGIPADQALAVLAKLLPDAVDKQSPEGQLQVPTGEPQQQGRGTTTAP